MSKKFRFRFGKSVSRKKRKALSALFRAFCDKPKIDINNFQFMSMYDYLISPNEEDERIRRQNGEEGLSIKDIWISKSRFDRCMQIMSCMERKLWNSGSIFNVGKCYNKDCDICFDNNWTTQQVDKYFTDREEYEKNNPK